MTNEATLTRMHYEFNRQVAERRLRNLEEGGRDLEAYLARRVKLLPKGARDEHSLELTAIKAQNEYNIAQAHISLKWAQERIEGLNENPIKGETK